MKVSIKKISMLVMLGFMLNSTTNCTSSKYADKKQQAEASQLTKKQEIEASKTNEKGSAPVSKTITSDQIKKMNSDLSRIDQMNNDVTRSLTTELQNIQVQMAMQNDQNAQDVPGLNRLLALLSESQSAINDAKLIMSKL